MSDMKGFDAPESIRKITPLLMEVLAHRGHAHSRHAQVQHKQCQDAEFSMLAHHLGSMMTVVSTATLGHMVIQKLPIILGAQEIRLPRAIVRKRFTPQLA